MYNTYIKYDVTRNYLNHKFKDLDPFINSRFKQTRDSKILNLQWNGNFPVIINA